MIESDYYDEWNILKKKINNKNTTARFHSYEIWWCHIGLNIGYEMNGKGHPFSRPVLVYRKFNADVFWGIPITTQIDSGLYKVSIDSKYLHKRQVVISQLRLYDAKRLMYKLGSLSIEDIFYIEKAIADITVRQSPFHYIVYP